MIRNLTATGMWFYRITLGILWAEHVVNEEVFKKMATKRPLLKIRKRELRFCSVAAQITRQVRP